MRNVSKRQREDFSQILAAIPDEKVRYFYLMLGDAIATQVTPAVQANTSPAHITELAARLNATG